MPHGFIGNASQKYLTEVGNAMASAHMVHGKNPLAGMGGMEAPPPTLATPSNLNLPHPSESSRSGGYATGIGNQSNVVVKPGEYAEVLGKMQLVNEQIAEEIFSIAAQLEEMCNTIYIVPFMKPKYLEYIGKVKAMLDEFQTLMDESRMAQQAHVDEITRIDNM